MNRIMPAILLAVFFAFFGGLATCGAAQPQRVAILPVYFHSIQSDPAVGRVIAGTLAERFRTPLASIVPVYDLVPPAEIAPLLPAAPAGKKIRLDGALLAAIGEKLGADIVVAAEVTQYYTYTYYSGEGDPMRRINFEIRLLSYHKPTGVFFDRRDHEYYNGDDTPVVQPDYLARRLTSDLLAKVPDYR